MELSRTVRAIRKSLQYDDALLSLLATAPADDIEANVVSKLSSYTDLDRLVIDPQNTVLRVAWVQSPKGVPVVRVNPSKGDIIHSSVSIELDTESKLQSLCRTLHRLLRIIGDGRHGVDTQPLLTMRNRFAYYTHRDWEEWIRAYLLSPQLKIWVNPAQEYTEYYAVPLAMFTNDPHQLGFAGTDLFLIGWCDEVSPLPPTWYMQTAYPWYPVPKYLMASFAKELVGHTLSSLIASGGVRLTDWTPWLTYVEASLARRINTVALRDTDHSL